MNTLSFFDSEKMFDPLPSPCTACGHSVGVVSYRDKTIVGLRCQRCGVDLDRGVVRTHPLHKDCGTCHEPAVSGVGFVVPRVNNNALHCINCGTWNWNVSNADLGLAPQVYQRPKISDSMKIRLCEEAEHVCLYHGGPGDLEAGHALSVSDGRLLNVPEDVLFDWWNLFAICRRCNGALGARSVKPSTYITLIKPGEFDKALRDPTFTKVLVLLGKALALRKEAA